MSEKRIIKIGNNELSMDMLELLFKFKKYRKRPLVIEAIQITQHDFSVETLEGTMVGKKRDYLIRGIKGELYPCDKDIFESSYDLVI